MHLQAQLQSVYQEMLVACKLNHMQVFSKNWMHGRLWIIILGNVVSVVLGVFLLDLNFSFICELYKNLCNVQGCTKRFIYFSSICRSYWRWILNCAMFFLTKLNFSMLCRIYTNLYRSYTELHQITEVPFRLWAIIVEIGFSKVLYIS